MTTIHSPSSEIIDITKLTPMNKSKDEWRYFCPICPEKRGKPDKEGKLYWNIVKSVGYCFKCATSFFPEGSEDEKYDRDEVEWKRSVEMLLRSFPNAIFDEIEFPRETHFDFPELSRELLIYLRNRNPFLLQLKDCLGLRAWKGRDTGVVIPFIYGEKICKFQARFVTKRGLPLSKNDNMKYYTSPGPKPLYSPFHIFGDFQGVGKADELTIAEGVFDAIALAVMGFPNPVAILGDKLTALHLYDIRHLVTPIAKINLCLDDMERNNAMEKVVKKFLPCVEETKKFSFWLPYYKDVEEWLVGNRDDLELMEQCTVMVNEWIKASKENT